MSLSRKVRAGLTLTVLLLGCGSSDEKPEPKQKVENIPLKSMYLSFEQEGTNRLRRGGDEPPAPDMRRINEKMTFGASNLLLVRGKDIAAAGAAARRVFVESHSADIAVSAESRPSDFCWLVAFLGEGPSSPPVWQVMSADKRGKTIRLTVVRPKRKKSSKDGINYFVWVPVGKLEDGTYKLELLNQANDGPSLVRRVVVKDKDR